MIITFFALKNISAGHVILLLVPALLGGLYLIWFEIVYRTPANPGEVTINADDENLFEVREELSAAREAVQDLTRLNEAKNEFVATINHELRTPLTSIIGYVEILKGFSTSENDANFRKYLDIIDRNADVLLELVEGILLLSALETANKPSEMTNCDLVEICEKAVVILESEIESASLTVEAQYDFRDNFYVYGNSNQISQIFRNLISNAVKFSPAGSKVKIIIAHHSDMDHRQFVRVEVKDEGIGIPEKDLQHLFSRFFRASNATENDIPGSGLGLAIVDRIVTLHQGEITVDSVVGRGTTFRVDLPVGVSPVQQMVMENREGVLTRSILAIENARTAELVEVAHEAGGAVGFYTFVNESEQILDFSRWLTANPMATESIIQDRKRALLENLHTTLTLIQTEAAK